MLLLTITLAHMLLTVPARVSQHHTIPHSRNLAAICPRDATPPKKRDFLGIFPKGGGGVFSIPKTKVFWYAKIILRCQNMFYNSGEVISDQFNHITLNSKSGKF